MPLPPPLLLPVLLALLYQQKLLLLPMVWLPVPPLPMLTPLLVLPPQLMERGAAATFLVVKEAPKQRLCNLEVAISLGTTQALRLLGRRLQLLAISNHHLLPQLELMALELLLLVLPMQRVQVTLVLLD